MGQSFKCVAELKHQGYTHSVAWSADGLLAIVLNDGSVIVDSKIWPTNLQKIICWGLIENGVWSRFLTRGIYDPRLFLFIVNFLKK